MQKNFQILKVLLTGFVLLTSWSQTATAQDYIGTLQDLYFGRQPSARAEALGKSMPATGADAFGSFYNPALIGPNRGISLNTSMASPYYALDDADFKFAGATVPVGRNIVVGLTGFQFKSGLETVSSPEPGPFEWTSSLYTLTIAAQPLQDLFIGVNVNHVRNDFGVILGKAIPIDFGIVKVFPLGEKSKDGQQISFALSLSNIADARLTYTGDDVETSKEVLPRIYRVGVTYQRFWGHHQIKSSSLKTLGILLQGEYQGLTNSKFRDGFRGGVEISLLEILQLRLGAYHEDVSEADRFGNPGVELEEFTYGLGINVPVRLLMKGADPLILKVDMTRLQQPSYSPGFDEWDKFTVINLSAVWTFRE